MRNLGMGFFGCNPLAAVYKQFDYRKSDPRFRELKGTR